MKFGATILAATTMAVSISRSYAQDLYLIIGQSNAAGRDEDIDPSGADSLTRDVMYLTDRDTFLRARQPLNQHSGIGRGDQGVNLGLEFGKEMHDDNNRRQYLVVNARGGTRVAEWRKGHGSGYYENSVERVEAAMNECNCRLTGVLWHQGEGNVSSRNGSFPRSYLNSLTRIIEDLRDDFGDVPFIVGQLFDNGTNDAFNAELTTVNDRGFLDDVDWVSSRGLTTFDGTHFDADSTRELGRRYAQVMQRYV